jgi:mRNA interferase RelE/StbE
LDGPRTQPQYVDFQGHPRQPRPVTHARVQQSSATNLAIAIRDIALYDNIAICDKVVMKSVLLTPAATRQWIKLAANVRARIMTKLTGYASTGGGDVKRLKGQAGCRLRVGDYRVIFIEDTDNITIVAAGHRREIYD